MYQFSTYLHELGKKVNWDTCLAGLAIGAKPDEAYHPFTPSAERLKKIRKRNQGNLSDFVNNMNNRGR